MPIRPGVDARRGLQELGAGQHVLILGRAGEAGVVGMLEGAAVADAEAIVHRQHDEAVRGQILVHRIGVGVIVHVVPAEQHLPRRPAVDEDHRRLARRAVRALEQLAVHGQAVGAVKRHRLGRDQSRGRKVGRTRPASSRARRAVQADHATAAGGCWAPAAMKATCAVAGGHRRPFDPFAGGERRRAPPRSTGHAEQMPPIAVAGSRAGVGVDRSRRLAVAAPATCSTMNGAGRQQQRRAAGRRDRIEMRPVVGLGQEHQPVAGRPVQVGLARRPPG